MPFRISEKLYATPSRHYILTLGHILSKTAQWKLGIGNRCLENNLLIVKKKKAFEWRHVKAFSSLELSELWLLKYSLGCWHANCTLEEHPTGWFKAYAQPGESPAGLGGGRMRIGTPGRLLTRDREAAQDQCSALLLQSMRIAFTLNF